MVQHRAAHRQGRRIVGVDLDDIIGILPRAFEIAVFQPQRCTQFQIFGGPGIFDCAAGIGYRAIRNRGTIGGSLAHADPAADWLAALAALGADAVVAGAGGERRVAVAELAQSAFQTVLGDGEILVAVEVPAVSGAARWGWTKLCRKPGEFAQAIAAVLHDPDCGRRRAVIGATQGAPIVLDDASEAAAEAALAGFDPIEQRLYRAALRRALAQVTR